MIYGTLFTMPNATTALSNIGSWSSPLFEDFLPIIYLIVAVSVIILVLYTIINAVRGH